MNEQGSYGQFCPVAMAAEILCTRWTMLVVREMLCGTTRFNDLRRGVPRMSPALLSKRLKELERSGIVPVRPGGRGTPEYHLSEAGEDLRPVVMGFGGWGQRWVESQLSLKNLDPSLLMWDMRRHLDPRPLPEGRCTIQFLYPELPEARRRWWLVVDQGMVDLCNVDPGFEVDLLVTGPLRSMTAVWMGISTVRREVEEGRLSVDGDPRLAGSMQRWLGLSPFAGETRRRP
ncbi:helix-turn-helix transcriptional regulator [Roseomonas sp. OT10]|uniref:winged helix-turn-helix transcriptional regulator n=1 Tax=Roseomonas cutis TaxID=2897332 RepID=UPI001E4A9F91|nr:helix-turn-helix domain-containing protein [Roseomonas sp. OT10]UFN50036.1 helix-turn-helix transcriptional regulator [Roseomonas sp. OT10]